MFEIIKASSPAELAIVKELFVEYQRFLGLDLCFQGFDVELAQLPYKYAEPEGCILLAQQNGKTAGVVALKKLEEGICEMKRLYVKPEFKGKGLGKLLSESIIAEATQKGYQVMKLDTLQRLREANQLYKKLDFQLVQSYNFNPEADVLYYAKTLNS